ncbi:hypothetical protein [Nesterenkonia sp. F]|nr:hypothetical protein [Nesterenkonia sp. F]
MNTTDRSVDDTAPDIADGADASARPRSTPSPPPRRTGPVRRRPSRRGR